MLNIMLGNHKCLEIFLITGATVNTVTKDGVSALILAVALPQQNCKAALEKLPGGFTKAYYNHNKCVEMLLESVADVNEVDLLGKTALTHAALN